MFLCKGYDLKKRTVDVLDTSDWTVNTVPYRDVDKVVKSGSPVLGYSGGFRFDTFTYSPDDRSGTHLSVNEVRKVDDKHLVVVGSDGYYTGINYVDCTIFAPVMVESLFKRASAGIRLGLIIYPTYNFEFLEYKGVDRAMVLNVSWLDKHYYREDRSESFCLEILMCCDGKVLVSTIPDIQHEYSGLRYGTERGNTYYSGEQFVYYKTNRNILRYNLDGLVPPRKLFR